MSDSADLLEIAIEATTLATKLIKASLPGSLTSKGDRDYASEVDYSVERELRAFLAETTPSIGFLGEEEGASGGTETQWALDPIDGTVNFAHGLPLCGVSLALITGRRPVLGVIKLPFLGFRYTAAEGKGAFRGGQRIHASSAARLHNAVVSIGDYAVGVDAERKNAIRLAITARLARTALRVRMFGSAAVDFAWLADGRTDAVITMSNKPWDTAAGVIIARESGAIVVDKDRSDHKVDSQATIAASPTLVDEVVALVQQAAESAAV